MIYDWKGDSFIHSFSYHLPGGGHGGSRLRRSTQISSSLAPDGWSPDSPRPTVRSWVCWPGVAGQWDVLDTDLAGADQGTSL